MVTRTVTCKDVTYSPEATAEWIVNQFIQPLWRNDLDSLKGMIAADLRYAYELGKTGLPETEK